MFFTGRAYRLCYNSFSIMQTLYPLDTDHFIKQISLRIAQVKSDRIRKAFETAKKIYGDNMHWTGVSCLDHAQGVLNVLLPFQPDEDGVIACLLHHYLNLPGGSLKELEEQFGTRVKNMVSGVHLLSHVSSRNKKTSIKDLRLMLLNVSDEVQTILIVLCNLCHLLEIAYSLKPAEKKRLSQDALELFAPVAARLGMYGLKHRLESQAFFLLYPAEASDTFDQIEKNKENYPDFLQEASNFISGYLSKQGILNQVETRQKQPYSAFRKLHSKGVSSLHGIYDLFAIRVVVETENDCYRALGFIHGMGKPLANRFKDYIAFPKPNGYRSLHTTMLNLPKVPPEVFVEVQIRTRKMHREAEFGIAAHWMYKSGDSTKKAMRTAQLKQVLSSQEAIEEEDRSGYKDQIFVLTPQGDIVELPEGATALDFAFAIHSDLGLCTRSVQVNGEIVPLSHELQNGDIVEVQKNRTPQPSSQWMNILKMSSSKSKLKHYLYAQDRDRLISEGKKILSDELKQRGLAALDNELTVFKRYDGQSLGFSEREDILMKIGQGSEKAGPLLAKIGIAKTDKGKKTEEKETLAITRNRPGVNLEGGLKLPIRFAKCCDPQGSNAKNITGVINRQGFVMIHLKKCKMLKSANPDRIIKAEWV